MREKRDFSLDITNIDSAVGFARELLQQCQCSARDQVRAQLFTEETLVYWLESAGAGGMVQISARKRFKTISLFLTYQGSMANPLAMDEAAGDEAEFRFIGQNILIGLSNVSYNYENGCNIVIFTLKEKSDNPLAAVIFALVAAVICGLTVNRLAPSLGANLNASVLTPLSNAFFGLLKAIVVPFLFVSVIASIFNMENVAQVKRIFRILFGWFVGLTVLSAVVTVGVGVLYFPLQSGAAAGAGEAGIWTQIAKMLFDIIPVNMLQSFVDGNTLQVIFIAIVTGIIMLVYKGRFPVITKVISEADLLLSTLLDAVCSLMPWVIFVCIFSIILSGQGKGLLNSIGVAGLICVCYLVIGLCGLLSVTVIEKQSPVQYLKTIAPILLIAVSTASSSATYATHALIANKQQGIREYLISFCIPVGALFAKPFLVPEIFLITLFIGQFYSLTFSMADIIPMILLTMILTIACPPTLGIGAFLFTIMFNRLGIPLEGLAMAISLAMIMDYLGTACDTLALNISMLHTEHRLRETEKTTAVEISNFNLIP
ncbi:MAG TPA: cation:dicarboxylase symporter family transporter [Syntrophomonas sp.]|nr:cation:dicarboxylase symporter family transporter [Syntrophomonas sp.]